MVSKMGAVLVYRPKSGLSHNYLVGFDDLGLYSIFLKVLN